MSPTSPTSLPAGAAFLDQIVDAFYDDRHDGAGGGALVEGVTTAKVELKARQLPYRYGGYLHYGEVGDGDVPFGEGLCQQGDCGRILPSLCEKLTSQDNIVRVALEADPSKPSAATHLTPSCAIGDLSVTCDNGSITQVLRDQVGSSS